jgi:arabinofuranan 3-O-arabinosyltransferase
MEPKRVRARPSWLTLPPALLEKIAYCGVALGIIGYFGDLRGQSLDGLTDGAGRPFGDDFVNFWSGAFLAWHHRAADIYNFDAFHAFEQSVVGAHLKGYHYSYPPMLLILTAPLATVPYVPGLFLWLTAGWFAFYRALHLVMRGGRALLFAMVTPAVFINALGAQNGTWTAALFGFGLGLLDRRPFVAGGLLGLLIYKPHLGILIPLALLAGRRWQAMAAAAIVSGGLIIAAALCFGPDIFAEYMQRVTVLRHVILEDGTGVWHRMVSIFVAARRLGADVPTAYLIQFAAACCASFAVVVVWFRNGSPGIRNAALILGTCLATPYLQDYDMVFGALVVAWLWSEETVRQAFDVTLFWACGAILLMPLFAAWLAVHTGLEWGPLFILPLFVIVVKCGLARPQPVAVTVATE